MASWIGKIARFSSLMKVITFSVLSALVLSYFCPFIHPETLWILPFFGLAYPILFVLSITLLIYWMLLRSRMFFVTLLILLIGGTLHFRMIATVRNPVPLKERDSVLRVLSYNVKLFDVYNESVTGRYLSRNGIISYVNEVQPDIVCFQEFFNQDRPTNFSTKDTLCALLKIKDYHERYSHKIKNRQNFGICMLSRYPIVAKGDVMFDNFLNSDNYCIFADIVKNKDTFRVYNIHLQSIKLQQDAYQLFDQNKLGQKVERSTIELMLDKLRIAFPARADQARRVVEHAETSPYPVIICGDFNDTPMSYVYNQFNKTMKDCFRETSFGIGSTYVGKVPAGRIDYIFHTAEIKAQNFNIQEKAFSDHRAIWCELYKKKN